MAERLDLSDGFDVHDYRAGLKLHTQDGASISVSRGRRSDCSC